MLIVVQWNAVIWLSGWRLAALGQLHILVPVDHAKMIKEILQFVLFRCSCGNCTVMKTVCENVSCHCYPHITNILKANGSLSASYQYFKTTASTAACRTPVVMNTQNSMVLLEMNISWVTCWVTPTMKTSRRWFCLTMPQCLALDNKWSTHTCKQGTQRWHTQVAFLPADEHVWRRVFVLLLARCLKTQQATTYEGKEDFLHDW